MIRENQRFLNKIQVVRSMKVQSHEEEKDKWSTKDDPRKTKWGSIYEKN